MKIISLQNKSKKGKIIFAFIISILFFFIFFNQNARSFISEPVLRWMGYLFNFKNKGELIDLRNKNAELESKILSLSYLEKENENLKNILSRAKKPNDFILASVISRPPQSPYDILIIDAGREEGIKEGMIATAFSEILLGKVIEVYSHISKIKLISFPGEKTNVYLLNTQMAAEVKGRGGENLEIQLPDTIEVNPGEQVITPETYALIVGTIEMVEINTGEGIKKLYLRLPLNIQHLKYVLIKK